MFSSNFWRIKYFSIPFMDGAAPAGLIVMKLIVVRQPLVHIMYYTRLEYWRTVLCLAPGALQRTIDDTLPHVTQSLGMIPQDDINLSSKH